MGYESIEMCSPPGYSMAGFAPLAELSASEMKNIMNGEGITCSSFHYIFPELKEHGQERMDFAKEIGLTQMVVSSFILRGETTLDDWKKAAHELNQLGEQSAKQGLQMAFHNHHGEFAELEGKLIYDVLLEELDPDLVKMQFQVAVANIGYKAADYFRKHPGRFISAHLSDWSKEGDDATAVPVGQGIVDWKEFFEAAKVGGLKNYFVEMNPVTFGDSAEYLKSLG
jgi:sugar phosphate isomerase/epimerase